MHTEGIRGLIMAGLVVLAGLTILPQGAAYIPIEKNNLGARVGDSCLAVSLNSPLGYPLPAGPIADHNKGLYGYVRRWGSESMFTGVQALLVCIVDHLQTMAPTSGQPLPDPETWRMLVEQAANGDLPPEDLLSYLPIWEYPPEP